MPPGLTVVRPSAGGKEGREEGERERQRPDNRDGEFCGGAREGSGPEGDTTAGASRAARQGPGGLQAPPPPPPLTDSASSPHSSRAVRGSTRAASPGLCHHLRPGSCRGRTRNGESWGRSAASARGRAGGGRPEPSSPLRVRSHCHHLRRRRRRRRHCRRRRRCRPALTRRRSRRRQLPATRRKWACSSHVTLGVGPGPRGRLEGRPGRRGFAAVG